MGATGCFSAYDVWFEDLAATEVITNMQVIYETAATRFVNIKCDSSAKSGATTAHSFEVPESAAESKTLYAGKADYWTLSSNKPDETATFCSQSFALKSAVDGVSVDDKTGAVTYDLKPSATGSKTVTIVVTTTNS